MAGRLLVLGLLLVGAWPACAELVLPPGFVADPYVSGQGFDSSGERGYRGIPSASTLGFDAAGALYVARTGARFRSGDVEDLAPIYRFSLGGARLTPDSEARYLFGPPLRNPQVGAVEPRGVVYVTTHDRDRKLGAVYRVVDGRPSLFAGGTPPAGSPPLLRHPEGVAVDRAGNVYVADREQGAIVRLDPTGKAVEPRWATITRPRMLAVDEAGHLWVGGDGTAETPFQAGAGEIWRVSPDGAPTLVLQGPLPAGLAMSPSGTLFVAQRRTGQVFVLTPDGRRIEFSTVKDGTFIRGLAFAPTSEATRRSGIAGNLFVIAIPRSMWLVNEVLRISGPFDAWVRQELDRH
jgi:sugar lactone lactonase YvrE